MTDGVSVENSQVVEAAVRLAAPFLVQDGAAWVGRCCTFLYAGARPADRCGSCKRPVVCTQCATEAEVRLWAEQGRR